VEEQGRGFGVASDDAGQCHPLQQVDQRARSQAEVVHVSETALLLGLYLQSQVVPDLDVAIAPVRDRRQLSLQLRLEAGDNRATDGPGSRFQGFDREVVRVRLDLQMLE